MFSRLFYRCGEHFTLRGVFLWSLLVILSSIVYVLVGMSLIASIIVMVLACAVIFFFTRSPSKHERVQRPLFPSSWQGRLLLVFVFVTDIFLATLLWEARIVWALQTPWMFFSIAFFLLFALASAVLLWLAWTEDARMIRWFTTLHYFVFYSVALIVFRLGFGYDPIIHQTAEQYIVDHGRIFPLQPFYIGQYVIVALLHHFTQVPVQLIDRLLLPVLTVITVPAVAYYGLTRAYGIQDRIARMSVVLVLILPMSLLTFTAPYNLTVLYTLWWIFLFPLLLRGTAIEQTTTFLIALAALVTHPLLGLPLVLVSLAGLFLRRYTIHAVKKSIGCSLGIAVLVTFSIVGMLALYRLIQGLPPLVFGQLSEKAFRFFNFFIPNFLHAWISWPYIVLYAVAVMIPLAVILIGAITCIRRREFPESFRVCIVGLTLGIFASMFAVTLFIHLPGVVAYEQAEFALRLRASLAIFFLPLFLVGAVSFAVRIMQRRIAITLFCIMGGVLMAGSWYMTYPRIDAAEDRAGWNAAQHDIDAVKRIEDDAAGRPYIVLADRLLAAVALRELGFDRTIVNARGERLYTYSLWPGDRTFSFAEKVLYGGFMKNDLVVVQNNLPNVRLYIAIHEYWYRVQAIERTLIDLGAERIESPYGVRVFLMPSIN